MDTLIAAGDQLIVVTEDDDTIRLASEPPAVDEAAIRTSSPAAAAPERTLVLGWNRRAPTIIRELDGYVAAGLGRSSSRRTSPAAETAARGARARRSQNQSVRFDPGRHDQPARARPLDVAVVRPHRGPVLLGLARDPARRCADAHHAPPPARHRGARRLDFSIVSEMLDVRNRALAEVTHADDFIVSERLVSLLMAQVAENAALNAVFADLFDQAGSEIYLRPAADYVAAGRRGVVRTVVASARRRGRGRHRLPDRHAAHRRRPGTACRSTRRSRRV